MFRTYLLYFKIQVQNLTEQLNAGIRYLDLRIAHKSHDPSMDLYFVHMIYTSVSVEVLFFTLECL